MKAITLWQPWASLVALGVKPLETRSWPTNYRGPLAIHAAKAFRAVDRELCNCAPFLGALRENRAGDFYGDDIAARLPLGCIVATCELADCIPTEAVCPDSRLTQGGSFMEGSVLCISPEAYAFGDFSQGRYAWLFKDIVPLPTPVPARGSQGFWEWEPTIPNPHSPNHPLVCIGEHRGRTAADLNADFLTMCADPGYHFGAQYICDALPLETQDFHLEMWKQSKAGKK